MGCVGVPLPQVKVRIIDPETLQELPHDTDGEVRRMLHLHPSPDFFVPAEWLRFFFFLQFFFFAFSTALVII
jgi:acyl-CoA synthetase (AMP-forming)/AMP-acid ligase II